MPLPYIQNGLKLFLPNRPQWSGPVGHIAKVIRVRDKNGVSFAVFRRETIELVQGRPRKNLWFELETGERGHFVDRDTFVLGSGEKFYAGTKARHRAQQG